MIWNGILGGVFGHDQSEANENPFDIVSFAERRPRMVGQADIGRRRSAHRVDLESILRVLHNGSRRAESAESKSQDRNCEIADRRM